MELLKGRDGLMGGICNGFQALIKLGLVPYGEIREPDAGAPTLTFNVIGRHQSRIVRTRVASTLSPWLMHARVGDVHIAPISHGEGRFIADMETVRALAKAGQIATQYVNRCGRADQGHRRQPPTAPCAPSRASPRPMAACLAAWPTRSAPARSCTGTCPEIRTVASSAARWTISGTKDIWTGRPGLCVRGRAFCVGAATCSGICRAHRRRTVSFVRPPAVSTSPSTPIMFCGRRRSTRREHRAGRPAPQNARTRPQPRATLARAWRSCARGGPPFLTPPPASAPAGASGRRRCRSVPAWVIAPLSSRRIYYAWFADGG